MQAFGDATPTSDAAAARLLLVAREATAAARTILQSYDKLQETEPAFMDKLKALRLELTAFAGEIANGAVATAASGTSEVIYASAFAVVFGSVLAWFIVRGIIVPLNAMTGAMTGLAAGDGTVDIPEMRSKSELGAMARAVDVFKQNADKIAAMLTAETTTREIGEVISGAAAGDLTIRVPLDNKVGFLRDIGEQVNRLLNATNAAFKEFGEKARHTAISVGEASAAVGQVSDGARSQSSALSQVATALKGINGFQLDKKARRNNTCQGGLRSIKGQSIRFDRQPLTSGVPQSTDILRVRPHVSNLHKTGLPSSPKPAADFCSVEFRSGLQSLTSHRPFANMNAGCLPTSYQQNLGRFRKSCAPPGRVMDNGQI